MPQLPANPNLDYLKGQAKALLKAYRANKMAVLSRIDQNLRGFTEASRFVLADAQTVIAREYGFPNWIKLKRYVEALSTELSLNKNNKLSRKHYIQVLSDQLLAWAKQGESEQLGNRLGVTPLNEILAVRDVVIAKGHHALLVDGLLKGLRHEQARVRFNCALALDHLADERCTEPLYQRLSDPVARVRRAALHSISCDACKVTPLPDRDKLTDKMIDMALHDPGIRVRRVAADSLAESCDDAILPVLQRLYEEDTSLLQKTARMRLQRQTGHA